MDNKMRPIILPLIQIPTLRDQQMTQLRLPVKPPYFVANDSSGHPTIFRTPAAAGSTRQALRMAAIPESPFSRGDILYVREPCYKDAGRYFYKADYPKDAVLWQNGRERKIHWCAPVAMPKEAARLLLRITEIAIERLQDITLEGAIAGGVRHCSRDTGASGWAINPDSKALLSDPIAAFSNAWDTSVSPGNMENYGWAANPWVYALRFHLLPWREANALMMG